jgi:CBS-domain-containing membrane protein
VTLLHKHRIEKLLVVADRFQLRGMITVKDIQKSSDKPARLQGRMGAGCGWRGGRHRPATPRNGSAALVGRRSWT